MKIHQAVLGALALAAMASAQASIVSVTAGAAVTGDRATNLIANGSFEVGNPTGSNLRWAGAAGSGVGGTPNGDGPSTPVPSWSVSAPDGAYGWWGSLGFSGAPCTNGNSCLYFGNAFTTLSAAPTFGANGVVTFGSAPAFTGGTGGPIVLSQSVSGLTVGSTYTLDFWISGEANSNAFVDAGVFGLGIGADSMFLTAVGTAANPGGLTGASMRYLVTFLADSATETISFTNWGHICGSCSEIVLDDVILNGVRSTSVPEPATLALVGLAALAGGLSRRRRR